MGIRVNKMLGYGLTDVKTVNDGIVDERFDPEGWFFANHETRIKTWNTEGFLAFWEEQAEKTEFSDLAFSRTNLSEIAKKEKENPHSYNHTKFSGAFIHDGEYGLPNVALLIPLDQIGAEWYRHDDAIDYAEETENHDQKNRFVELPWGIYPWNASFSQPDGKRWTGEKASLVREFMRTKSIFPKDLIAKELGFETIEEAKKGILPFVPEQVRMLCLYAKMFKDLLTIFQLKPMFYVFWG